MQVPKITKILLTTLFIFGQLKLLAKNIEDPNIVNPRSP